MCPFPLPRGTGRAPAPRPPAHPAQAASAPYVVLQVAVAAGLGQQQLDDLHMPVLAGTHEGRGALVVLDVDVSAAGQQAPHHVDPPVADGQHEGRLSRLWGETHQQHSRDRPGGRPALGGGGKRGAGVTTEGTKQMWN